MTPQSIAVAMAGALLTGLVGGWVSREWATGRNWSFAVSAAIGLLLVQVSSVDALLGKLIPTSAIGWLPWICLAVAGVQSLNHQRLRVISALVLGLAIVLRLLWGSVYLSESNHDLIVIIAIAAWSAAIGTAITVNKPAIAGRLSMDVLGWALLVALSVCVIVATGSLTYGVATGIVGVAIVANLLGASRLPTQGSAILLTLIGLSVAFSETPLWLGMLLIAVALAITYLSQEDALAGNHPHFVRGAVYLLLIGSAAFPVFKLFAPADEYGGYGAAASGVANDVAVTQSLLSEDRSISEPEDDAIDSESMPDPFSGFGP